MYSYEDLKKAPVGTKVTFENNGDILVKTTKYTIENKNTAKFLINYENLESVFNDLGKIIKIEEPTYTTVYEVKEILDDKEKEYLSAVIKPFRYKLKCILKTKITGYEYIHITLRDEDILLPKFKSKTMYRGMEEDKEYTLEELGL